MLVNAQGWATLLFFESEQHAVILHVISWRASHIFFTRCTEALFFVISMTPPFTSLHLVIMSSNTLPHASPYHVPIMVHEVLDVLNARAGASFIDGTLGGGGHSEALLTHTSPTGRVIGLDRDIDAITEASSRLASFGERFTAVHTNYDLMREALDGLGVDAVDGVLIDAGVSSHQLDTPERGFSFRHDGPLDMRMGNDEAPTLAEFLTTQDPESLTRVLQDYGELKGAFRIANGILDAFAADALHTTGDLNTVVLEYINPGLLRKMNISPSTLVFQALRIAINDELTHLEAALHAAISCVRPGGRVAFMCFHSLEDRIIKQGLRAMVNPCICPSGLPICACGKQPRVKLVTRKPMRASPEECAANPRARSAMLRAATVLPTT